jgi:hypothetical protein
VWDALLPKAGPQALANVLWACGKVEYSQPRLWSSTIAAFMQMHEPQEENASQHIANVVYGMAVIALANRGQVSGVPRAQVEAAVAQLVSGMRVLITHPQMEGVDPQAISNTLWGCAKLRINPGDAAITGMLQAMARPAMLEGAVPQVFSNTLWSASELQQHCGWQSQVQQRVWRRLLGEQQLRSIATDGKSNQISNVVLAVMWLSRPAEPGAVPALDEQFAQQCVLQLLQGTVTHRVTSWEPQPVANTMWACAKLGVCPAEFFEAAALATSSWVPHTIAAHMHQVARACRELDFRNTQLMAAVVQRTQHVLQHRRRQKLPGPDEFSTVATVCYACSRLDMRHLAGSLRDLVASSDLAHEREAGRLGMLWVVHAWLVQHQLLDGQGLAGLLSEQQLADGKAAAEAYRAQQQQQA